jgi:hypothetical protein
MLMQFLLFFFDKYFVWLDMNVIEVAQNTVKRLRLDAFTRLIHILNKFMLLPANLICIKEIISKCPSKILKILLGFLILKEK